jgi:hypothetical protein
MRDFIFSIWAKVGKTSSDTVAALESLAAKQYTTAEQGGRVVVSASVQGKSFTYEIPEGQTSMDFLEQCRGSWRQILIGGITGAQMTDAELLTYLLDAEGEVTNTTVASFTRTTQYGY